MKTMGSVLELARANPGEAAKIIAAYGAELSEPDRLGQQAWMYHSIGLVEQALETYRVLLAICRSAEVLALTAGAHLSAGQTPEALQLAGEALALDAANFQAFSVLARFHTIGGRPFRPFPHEALPRGPLDEVSSPLDHDPAHFQGSLRPEIQRLVYWLVRCLKPRVAVEIGVYRGYTLRAIASGVRDNAFGHLHAFDLFKGRHLEPFRKDAEVPYVTQLGQELAEEELASFVTLHEGDSSSMLAEHFARSGEEISFAIIDGDHRLAGCFNDFNAVARFAEEGALVLLHDTIGHDAISKGPAVLAGEVGKLEEWAVIELSPLDNAGLALLWKKSHGESQLRPPLLEKLAEAIGLLKGRAAL